ncbi:MAG: glycosyltransferase family 2 protein [Bacteroidota bacterium]
MILQIIFWIAVFLILYTYIGYPMVLFTFVFIKRKLKKSKKEVFEHHELPETTLIVPCFNEADYIRDKIDNTLLLKYPEGRLTIFFVTDGSTDESMDIIKGHPEIILHHSDERKGKNAAVNRVMEYVKTPTVIFCDANTLLNEDAIVNIVRHYKDPKVGAVAGEKRVLQKTADGASASGEGAYWKYESQLKKWDSELQTVVGAAGELFSVRVDLYEKVPENIIIEDFYLSMRIVEQGFKTVYEPDSYASETSSESIKEERKRKIRISAGGIQAIILLKGMLNIFKHGMASFQYISHRALRWTLTPLALIIALSLNIVLAYSGNIIYIILLAGQIAFYLLALLGYILQEKEIKLKGLFIPYYFFFMNWSVYQGFFRFMKGKQSAVWEKAKRASA